MIHKFPHNELLVVAVHGKVLFNLPAVWRDNNADLYYDDETNTIFMRPIGACPIV
jgi:hypothetical protein